MLSFTFYDLLVASTSLACLSSVWRLALCMQWAADISPLRSSTTRYGCNRDVGHASDAFVVLHFSFFLVFLVVVVVVVVVFVTFSSVIMCVFSFFLQGAYTPLTPQKLKGPSRPRAEPSSQRFTTVFSQASPPRAGHEEADIGALVWRIDKDEFR
jgi:hypothetical protein